MPKINLLPILKSVIIALVFFTLGRMLTQSLGWAGIWVTVSLLVIFYAAWWWLGRRKS